MVVLLSPLDCVFLLYVLLNRCVVLRFVIGSALSLLLSGNTLAQNVKVAFVGDQGIGANAQAVLRLIADEATDLLLIQGDLGYVQNAAQAWEDNLTNILGVNFPVLTVVGNHENYQWPTYKSFISARLARTPELACVGDIGVKALCSFRGLEFVQVAPGVTEVAGVNGADDYAAFINQSLSGSKADWRICSWHKNQNKMQVGGKADEAGWGVYQACLQNGAIVATGHEHSYSRTYLMSDFQLQSIVNKSSHLEIDKGASFAFVSGLGGKTIRHQVRNDPWWAAIQTNTQGANHGALFCEFEDKQASCYFKDISGALKDSFNLTSLLNGPKPVPNRPEPSPLAYLVAIIMSLLE